MNTNNLPLVPLGENVTRDGRKARVICNDRVSPVLNPVIALVTGLKGREMYVSYSKSGRYRGRRDTPLDLVGHLPPEPAKPREVWIRDLAPHRITWELADPKDGKHALFREVLPGEADELEDLRRWKAEATTLLGGIPLDQIGKEIPGLTLGDHIGPAILPYIRSLKKFIGDLRQPHVSASTEVEAAFLLEP